MSGHSERINFQWRPDQERAQHPGLRLRKELVTNAVIEPFLGSYDCFSATIAARYSPNLFLSGFGFSASHYGLPDVGYVSWTDIVGAAWRIRQILPDHKLLVDIDDGYVDIHTACLVVSQLESMGVAMVMLEDQARPRRCGHMEGKRILPLHDYIEKLNAVLERRNELCVLARTDASGEDIFRRLEAITATDADAVLVDGVDTVEILDRVVRSTDKPVLFNQLAGGRSPRLSISELRSLGVRMVQYSTPLLFAAQQAMTASLETLFENDGAFPNHPAAGTITLKQCNALLETNVHRPSKLAKPVETSQDPAIEAGKAARARMNQEVSIGFADKQADRCLLTASSSSALSQTDSCLPSA